MHGVQRTALHIKDLERILTNQGFDVGSDSALDLPRDLYVNMLRASTDYHNVLAHRCLNWVTGIKFAEKHFAPEEYLLSSLVLFPEMHPEMSQMMIDTIKGKLHCIPDGSRARNSL